MRSNQQSMIKCGIKMNLQEGKGGEIPTHNYYILMITNSYKGGWWRRGGSK
jgi:hypothetical protein